VAIGLDLNGNLLMQDGEVGGASLVDGIMHYACNYGGQPIFEATIRCFQLYGQ
jgi:hypothetical protein